MGVEKAEKAKKQIWWQKNKKKQKKQKGEVDKIIRKSS